MSQSKSSKQWLQEHFSDQYVKAAQSAGYRSRSAFKLLEIQEKDHLIRPGMTVVDLGAAPGGWSQVVVKLLKGKGRVFALDILPMAPISGVEFIQGDFREEETLQLLLQKIGQRPVDVVISDMAPNISGIKAADQAGIIYLAELAFDLVRYVLKTEGTFLVKIFQGAEFQEYLQLLRKHFRRVVIRKPAASRGRSPEIYILATGFKKV